MKQAISKSILAVASAAMMILSSCSSEDFDYLPFKSSQNGGWGLINAKGQVIYEGEFKRDITAAHYGAFFGKTDSGNWILYSTKDKTPTPKGEPYSQAGAFIAEVAPVVKPGERITLINPAGEVKVTLGDIEGEPVIRCYNFFSDGLAVIETTKGYGVINTSGDVIITPGLKDAPRIEGGIIAYHNDEKDEYVFYNTSGKQTGSISGEKHYITSMGDGLLGVRSKGPDGGYRCGIMTPDGKWKLEPSARINAITEICDGNFIFENNDNRYGVMNLKGDELIPARFSRLGFACGGKLFMGRYPESEHYNILNAKQETIMTCEECLALNCFSSIFFAKGQNDVIEMFTPKGKPIKLKTDVVEVDISSDIFGDEYVKSEYVDTEALAKKLGITANGILGLNLDLNPKAAAVAVREAMSTLSGNETEGTGDPNPEEFAYSDEISSSYTQLEGFNCSAQVKVIYPSNVVGYNEDYVYDSWGYAYATGTKKYYFNTISPSSIRLDLNVNSEQIGNKLFKEISDILLKDGTKESSEENGLCVKTAGGIWKLEKSLPDSGSGTITLILSKDSGTPIPEAVNYATYDSETLVVSEHVVEGDL